ncbi:MAG: CopG family transcriptional regulator [Candidatus Liptonbacteria bacterium]|nr:CopG family transcriptional regulator [Candidatus Liptonbacteria bacterium]
MKYTTVSIPAPLHKKIQKIIKKSGFPSSSSFVIFLLREILADEVDGSLLSDKERIKERLRALGYM